MKVAITHDWLNGMRGGEKVLEVLLEIWPEATIYTLFHERGRVSPAIESHPIVVSWLDRIPGIYRHYRNLLPLFPAAIASLDVGNADLVISSSHAVAKGVRSGDSLHICYCHTPMRYIWDSGDDYSPGPIQRAALGLFRSRLRAWDRETAAGVDQFIANSRFVGKRIQSCYGRTSTRISPPVDTQFYSGSRTTDAGRFFLSVGALVPYKKVDLAITSFNQSGKPLVVVGDGPERARLTRLAGPNIQIRGWVGNSELRQLYLRARALVFPCREDFGIAPVEARSCGCPVIAYAAGGASESIEDGKNGLLFGHQSVSALTEAIERFDTVRWSEQAIRSGTSTFSRERFRSEIEDYVASRWDERRRRSSGEPAGA